jgi:hypothetical protein
MMEAKKISQQQIAEESFTVNDDDESESSSEEEGPQKDTGVKRKSGLMGMISGFKKLF